MIAVYIRYRYVPGGPKKIEETSVTILVIW